MGVNGAVTNQEFYIGAASKVDRYIARLDFTITYGTSGGGWEWADANAVLSNGIRIYYQSQRGDIDIHEGITNNQDFLRLRKEPLPNNWEVRHLGAANDYGYTVVIDFVAIGFPHGIKLDRGSAQKLAVTIRDDVSDADVFNGIAMGTSRFEL
jgi:hypothetical protein